MADVSINLGTEGSSISGSDISIGNVAGRDVSERPYDHIWREIRDVKDRLRAIEIFLAGSPLGEPGLTSQVREIKHEIDRIEREVSMIDAMDARMARFEAILNRYDPMWRSMEASYASRINIPMYLFYAVLLLLLLSIVVGFAVVWAGRV